MERQAEEDQAWEAAKMARSEATKVYAVTQEDPRRRHIPKAKRMSMIGAATSNLVAAKDRLESLKRRSDLIRNFFRGMFGYSKANGVGSSATSTQRTLASDEDDSGRRSPKRQMLDHRELGSHSIRSGDVLAEAGETQKPGAAMNQDEVQGLRTKQSAARRSRRSMDSSQAISSPVNTL
ncbi:hypothetical protein B0T17DRAFT_511534 [Bombardia bombarda]|uniref:Uncharacterized protein n=1 Tax=Bombardia bombarda TaxID=252184 RepID=A0AA39WCC2_9PEZI|nr:hypothetical protein B0T17DRAFT_511534 [Bombardia bombarda]